MGNVREKLTSRTQGILISRTMEVQVPHQRLHPVHLHLHLVSTLTVPLIARIGRGRATVTAPASTILTCNKIVATHVVLVDCCVIAVVASDVVMTLGVIASEKRFVSSVR